MNLNKICFIICYTDELFLEECCLYIRTLLVPQNMEIDILTIKDAPSMTAGYQTAMGEADAKYKVYLHQDVFILNDYFLYDILEIFREKDIGMIGMAGTVRLPEDGVMWHDEESRCGIVRHNLIVEESVSDFPASIEGRYREVGAIDGLLMATQVDIPWRTDLFTGWDFYDVSQSMEFRKAGYRIVVPKQSTPWCIHDEDVVNLDSYEYWRKVFVENYGEFLRNC